jgi:hypothetical protein
MKTKIDLYKVNGKTFYNHNEVLEYVANNNFEITDSEVIEHKGKVIELINVTGHIISNTIDKGFHSYSRYN